MSNFLRLLFIVPALFCLLGDSAEAQRIRLEASMGANDGIQAKAKFEQRGARLKFNVEVEDGAANQVYGVVVSRRGRIVDSAMMLSDAFGVAEIDVDTAEGDRVPSLQRGDVVQIWFQGRRILAGTLR